MMELFLTVLKMTDEVENQLEQHWRAALRDHLKKKKKTTKILSNLSMINMPYGAATLGSQEFLMNSVPSSSVK